MDLILTLLTCAVACNALAYFKGTMKVVFLAAVASLLVFDVSANEAEKKQLHDKSKALMDDYYKGVIKSLKELKAKGKTYTADSIKAAIAVISVEEFTKHTAEATELTKLQKKLEKSGEEKDFKIYESGSPELKKELDQVVSDLIRKDGLAPRVIGALLMGGTQLLTDMIRMMFTRYGEMPDSHRVQYVPVG